MDCLCRKTFYSTHHHHGSSLSYDYVLRRTNTGAVSPQSMSCQHDVRSREREVGQCAKTNMAVVSFILPALNAYPPTACLHSTNYGLPWSKRIKTLAFEGSEGEQRRQVGNMSPRGPRARHWIKWVRNNRDVKALIKGTPRVP